MAKKKARSQPVSHYAVIDLPLDIAIERVRAMYPDNPLAVIKETNDGKFHIDYDLKTVSDTEINASVTLMSWEGTQTLVTLRSYEEFSKYNFDPPMAIIIIFLTWFFCFVSSLFVTPMIYGFAVAITAVILYLTLTQTRRLTRAGNLNKRVATVWFKLIEKMSDDGTGVSRLIVDQGVNSPPGYDQFQSDQKDQMQK